MKIENYMKTMEQQLEECKMFIHQLCWLGDNGSPTNNKEVHKYELYIINWSAKKYEEIFNEDPYRVNK